MHILHDSALAWVPILAALFAINRIAYHIHRRRLARKQAAARRLAALQQRERQARLESLRQARLIPYADELQAIELFFGT